MRRGRRMQIFQFWRPQSHQTTGSRINGIVYGIIVKFLAVPKIASS
jgi:hypothetical protein